MPVMEVIVLSAVIAFGALITGKLSGIEMKIREMQQQLFMLSRERDMSRTWPAPPEQMPAQQAPIHQDPIPHPAQPGYGEPMQPGIPFEAELSTMQAYPQVPDRTQHRAHPDLDPPPPTGAPVPLPAPTPAHAARYKPFETPTPQYAPTSRQNP
ncbi:MAG TPA: hypothetical protein DEB24_02550, partial [Coriobacteriia bacterium]|nr:hypothetical protein [Coriobacteriia bacterium]